MNLRENDQTVRYIEVYFVIYCKNLFTKVTFVTQPNAVNVAQKVVQIAGVF